MNLYMEGHRVLVNPALHRAIVDTMKGRLGLTSDQSGHIEAFSYFRSVRRDKEGCGTMLEQTGALCAVRQASQTRYARADGGAIAGV